MNNLALAIGQVRYTNKSFWRNPASAFFTFVFPLMFLVIFTAIFGTGQVTTANGNTVSTATFYIPPSRPSR
jgi:ABC-2 type transport system permease protein